MVLTPQGVGRVGRREGFFISRGFETEEQDQKARETRTAGSSTISRQMDRRKSKTDVRAGQASRTIKRE
jgi:hypothetical protein